MTRKLLPLYCLLFFGLLAYLLIAFKPQAHQRISEVPPLVSVEVQLLSASDYQTEIGSFGTVQPRTQSTLLGQVSGQVIAVSDNFRDGGFFEKGQILLEIDPRDYQAQELVAQSELADAQLALAEEQARAEQARNEWSRMGNSKQGADFALRKPQLAAAQARVRATEAKLAQARLNVERTQIRAPFAGRVLTTNVDLGSVISSATNLAEIYAIDFIEIRLPIKAHDLSFIDLPEAYRFQQIEQDLLPDVQIEDRMGLPAEIWQGKVVRTEGALDSFSHQLYVIAQIDDPYGNKAEARRPLKMGQYVSARIQGRVVKDIIVIPNSAIYQGAYVYIVIEGTLQRRNIEIAWQNDKEALISSGLEPGDRLVLTPLGQVSSGTRVSVVGDTADSVSEPSHSVSNNKKKRNL